MDKAETTKRLNKVFKNKLFESNVRLLSVDERGEPVEFSFNIDRIVDMISVGEWTPTCIVSVNIVDAGNRFKLVHSIVGDDFLSKNYITKVDLEHSISEMIEPFFDGVVLVKIPDEPNNITIDIK